MFWFSLGRASIYILRTAFGVDWSERIKIIYAGDDASDEDAMLVCINCLFNIYNNKIDLYSSFVQALKGMAATFRVTSSHIVKTSAEHRLPSTDSVLTMLKWVERHVMRRKPRANSLTYRHKKKDGVTMQMSFDLVPSALLTTSSNNSSNNNSDEDFV